MPQEYKNKKKLTIASPCKYVRGFTMVELVVVIVVMAIIGTMSIGFIRLPVQGFINTENNLGLADEVDTALRRMGRDIRNALPNSVRVTTNGADSYLEFIPLVNGGRYRVEVAASGVGDTLDISKAGDSFDIYGLPMTIGAGEQLVVYNLGITGADAYAGDNRRTLTAGSNLSNLTFSGTALPFASPSSRFYTVNGAVSYVCDLANKRLLRYGSYSIGGTQPSSLATLNGLATGRLLASDVSACTMQYSEGLLQRSGIVTINLTLSRGGANARLIHIINVVNSP